MKKFGLLFKEISENRIKKNLKDSMSFFVISYSKVSSPDLTGLRLSLKKANATLFMVKNSVVKRALKDSGLDSLVKTVEGPCGLVFTREEPVEASRILFNFTKDHAQLKLGCGVMKDRILESKDIEAVAKLPSREVLRAELVSTLNSPLFRLVTVCKQNLNMLVYCLEQKQKKNN